MGQLIAYPRQSAVRTALLRPGLRVLGLQRGEIHARNRIGLRQIAVALQADARSFTDVIARYLHTAIDLYAPQDIALNSQPLWRECLAVAMPLRHRLLGKPTLTLEDCLEMPVFRWQTEICPRLDRQRFSESSVPSFEPMALWVAAGYGVGITTQSRITNVRTWNICMRWFADVPYHIINVPCSTGNCDVAYDRFEFSLSPHRHPHRFQLKLDLIEIKIIHSAGNQGLHRTNHKAMISHPVSLLVR